MQRKEVALTDKHLNLISFVDFGSGSSNSCDISKMKNILHKAIALELTEKQRICICEYYFEKKSMREIAKENNIHPSTVTRHIKCAIEKLQKVARYY